MLLPVFQKEEAVKAYFSSKSKEQDQSYNFSKPYRADNKKKLAQHLNTTPENILFCEQSHSSNVALVTEENKNQTFENTDALLTNIPKVCINAITADCCPILLFDPINRAVGAIHAGWRGSSTGIIGNAIVLMQQTFNTKPENLMAAIGPCISAQVYEVGTEVKDAYQNLNLDVDEFFTPGKIEGKYYLDLALANKNQLLLAGIPMENIEHQSHCTYSEKSKFYSARQQGIDTGRMANGIMLT